MISRINIALIRTFPLDSQSNLQHSRARNRDTFMYIGAI